MTIFYQPDIAQTRDHLSAEESHHAVKVLRLKNGDKIQIIDGHGNIFHARVTEANAKHCGVIIENGTFHPKRKFSITLAVAPTKNIDRIEWFVEKAVELGVEELYFFTSKHSERAKINLERVQKICVSAMKQSGQYWMPQLHQLVAFDQLLELPFDEKYICYVDHQNTSLLKSIATPNRSYLVLIGPEGDFATHELNLALEKQFKKVSLGPNRLRTETAALSACAQLNYINL